MRWFRRVGLFVVVTLLTASASLAPTPTLAQSPGQPVDGWVSLGPDLPIEMYGLGVSSAWPDDPFIIARTRYTFERGSNRRIDPETPMIRTSDGGVTWKPLPNAPSADRLTVIRSQKFGRVILSLPDQRRDDPRTSAPPRHLYRSTDDGDSWSPVYRVVSRDVPTIILSPAIAEDGYAYLIDGGVLLETSDFGATWTQREPVEQQSVRAIVFSPTFAHDRTIYASVTTAGFRRFGNDNQRTAPTESAGVMLSHDAGRTWTAVSDGLEIDGAPYRHVQALAISPGFEQDHTLFAFAWGPWEGFDSGGLKWKHTALFRSQDSGVTWEVVWQPDYRPNPLPGGLVPSFELIVRPFPTFGDDGRIAVAVQSGAGTPGSGGCALMHSDDRGDGWRSLDTPDSLTTCVSIIPTQRDPTMLVVGGIRDQRVNEAYVVTEQESSFLRAPAPSDLSSSKTGTEGPVVGADGSIFFGTNNGVWMLPPDAPLPLPTPTP